MDCDGAIGKIAIEMHEIGDGFPLGEERQSALAIHKILDSSAICKGFPAAVRLCIPAGKGVAVRAKSQVKRSASVS